MLAIRYYYFVEHVVWYYYCVEVLNLRVLLNISVIVTVTIKLCYMVLAYTILVLLLNLKMLSPQHLAEDVVVVTGLGDTTSGGRV